VAVAPEGPAYFIRYFPRSAPKLLRPVDFRHFTSFAQCMLEFPQSALCTLGLIAQHVRSLRMPDEAQILMQEFASMREELLLQVRNTKLHIKHALAFLGAALALVWYLFLVQGSGTEHQSAAGNLSKILNITQGDLIIFVVFSLDILSFYFAFDILDSYYCLFLAAARLSSIEKRINHITEQRLMVWESQFANHAVSKGWSRITLSTCSGFHGVFSTAAASLLLADARFAHVSETSMDFYGRRDINLLLVLPVLF
jgi:uncharacterized membrane protein (DUF373 family)